MTDFLLKAKASGLGHDVVIEVMIGLLGVMMAALSLGIAIVAILIAIFSFIGYESMKKKAIEVVRIEAKRVNATLEAKIMKDIRRRDQATELSESLEEGLSRIKVRVPVRSLSTSRIKATSDKSLAKDKK